jgi:DNA-binding response OmpR family regulator
MGEKVGNMRMALVVDDDAQVRSEISLGLAALGWSSEGMSMASAAGGSAEIPFAKYSLVFMPASADGFACLASSVREAAKGCLVIALADLDREDGLKAAIASGAADDFLGLPFSPQDLRGICKLLEGRTS